MKKTNITLLIISLILLSSCATKSTKKRNLDQTLFKYAKIIRFTDYDAALNFLNPKEKDSQPSSFELEHLKQFRVSGYNEYPIQPGETANTIQQTVRIRLYNIHNNKEREVIDNQVWEYDDERSQWYLKSGLPKLK